MKGFIFFALLLVLLVVLTACKQETLKCSPLDESDFDLLLLENETEKNNEQNGTFVEVTETSKISSNKVSGEAVALEVEDNIIVKEFKEGDLVSFPNLFKKKSSTVTYAFTAPLNSRGEWQTKKGDAGTHPIKIITTDGTTKVIFSTLITILHRNDPPMISLNNKTIYVKENQTVVLNPVIFDPDSDNVTIVYSGWMTEPTKQTTFDDDGVYSVTITASDGMHEVHEIITVVVEEINRPPVFNS